MKSEKSKRGARFAEENRKARRLARQMAPRRKIVKDGPRARETSTANRVFKCSQCGAPVVDSKQGRQGHAQRKPECEEAMR